MEKIILAIILLNVIVSLIAKKRRQQAKALEKPSPRTPSPKPGSEPGSPGNPEKPPQLANTGERPVATGKNILHDVARELGLDLEMAQEAPLADGEEELQPEMPETEEEFQEMVTEDSPESAGFSSESLDPEWSGPDKKKSQPPILQKQGKARIGTGRVLNLRRYWHGARPLKEAFVLKTILDRPVSLRRRPNDGRRRIS